MTAPAFALPSPPLVALLLALCLALLGHAMLWAAMVNRLHAMGIPRPLLLRITFVGLLVTCIIPCLMAWELATVGWNLRLLASEAIAADFTALVTSLYLVGCWLSAAVSAVVWLARRAAHRASSVLRSYEARLVRVHGRPKPSAGKAFEHHFLARLPGNQILHVDVSERVVDVPRLPPALDGLSIVHLSDLHLTGRIGKGHFQELVRLCNKLEPDLIALTGDLVDKRRCMDWIPDTLGQLRARHGVYYVLGNHDRRTQADGLCRLLEECGLVHLGGRWIEIAIGPQRVILAGNELPWMSPAADLSSCPPRDGSGGPLRIGLTHTPDQLAWARRFDMDLLLAGHTHGGQICVPLLGAVLAPSWRGVKYASGLFYEPPTIMHVTRGVSGEVPLRLHCPPELARLILRSPEAPASRA